MLPSAQVECWRAWVDVDSPLLAGFETTLSADEIDASRRFRFDRDRRRFVFTRGVTRRILADYVGTAAAELRFAYGAHGKPYLVDGGMRFNVAHSADLLCVAIGGKREIGVDVEAIRDDIDILTIAQTVFGKEEAGEISALHPADRVAAFFAQWTRTEALLKAMGQGLQRMRGTQVLRAANSAWSVQSVAIADGYAAAIAVAGPFPPLTIRDFSGRFEP